MEEEKGSHKKWVYMKTEDEKGEVTYKRFPLSSNLSESYQMHSRLDFQKYIASLLGTKQVAYNPDLCRICRSVKAGILLNQLLYWWNKKKKKSNSIYKTNAEIEEEVALTRREQDGAVRRLKDLGFIKIEVKGIPPKRYFTLNIDEIVNSASDYYQYHGKE